MALKSLPPTLNRLPSRVPFSTEQGVDRSVVRYRMNAWRAWYQTARWKQLRLHVFIRDHFTCQWKGCGKLEGKPSQLVAHHVRRHKGNANLFWDEANLITVCKACHDGPIQAEEARAAALGLDLD